MISEDLLSSSVAIYTVIEQSLHCRHRNAAGDGDGCIRLGRLEPPMQPAIGSVRSMVPHTDTQSLCVIFAPVAYFLHDSDDDDDAGEYTTLSHQNVSSDVDTRSFV